MPSKVECRSEGEYAENPRALYWNGQRLEVDEVAASWRTPQGKGFRVRAGGSLFFDLIYNEENDDWTIHQLGSLTKGE